MEGYSHCPLEPHTYCSVSFSQGPVISIWQAAIDVIARSTRNWRQVSKRSADVLTIFILQLTMEKFWHPFVIQSVHSEGEYSNFTTNNRCMRLV